MVGPKNNPEEDTLVILVSEAIDGNQSSCRDLSSKISLKLRSYIYRSTLDEDLTNDILQETMLIMIEKIGGLKDPEAFWGWLFKIASNCIINHYRQNARRKKLVSFQDIMLEKAASDSSSPEARLMTRELSDTVRQAISILKPRQRQTISLRCFEDMSFKEIGSILNISEVSARVDFHRGLERIRQSLKKQGFSKASLALALTFFGKITAHSDAAATAISVTGQNLAAAAIAESASIVTGTAAK
ncbi:MAG: sigma-70 family RNA polymerase sigma factor, partial [Proteobacteria bacterium]|nr:sigma-70 family RNA polymerase sigma factor [Pseudomonadota bacterium]